MVILWTLFPGCRCVHLIRDGRDVAQSLRTLSWGSRDLIKLVQDWCWKVMLGRKMGVMVAGSYLEVKFETPVQSPADTLATICAFLGEPFEEGMLRYSANTVAEMPGNGMHWHQSSVRAPNPDKIQSRRSMMSTSDRAMFEQIAGEELEMFGYERSMLRPTIRSRIQFARYALLGHT